MTDAPALPIVVAEWPRNAREIVRVTLDTFKGSPTINVRVWYRTPTGELKPGNKGLTLGISHLPNLSKAFIAAERQANECELLSVHRGA